MAIGIIANVHTEKSIFPASEKRFDRRKSEMIEQLRRSGLIVEKIRNSRRALEKRFDDQ
jgi:hypothetical protein